MQNSVPLIDCFMKFLSTHIHSQLIFNVMIVLELDFYLFHL